MKILQTILVILFLTVSAYADGIRFSVAANSTFNEPIEYSSKQEIPMIKISIHWGEIYGFAQYMRDEMTYMGQKCYVGNDWGAGLGWEKSIVENFLLFVDAGIYWRGIDPDNNSFSEGIMYLFEKQFSKYKRPDFKEYDLELEPTLGITFGVRYYFTKNFSMFSGVHLRSHDANIEGKGIDSDPEARWTMKFKEREDRIFAGFSYDCF